VGYSCAQYSQILLSVEQGLMISLLLWVCQWLCCACTDHIGWSQRVCKL